MAKVIKTTFKLRRGTWAEWQEKNPILAQGEPGFAYDTFTLRIGNGILPWTELPDINGTEEAFLFTGNTVEDFPLEGSEDILYRAIEEKKLYQWNGVTQKYEALNEISTVNVNSLVQDEGDVLILYGGSASDLLEV